MYRWNNDYNQSAHPKILQALEKINSQNFPGYGKDELCQKAADKIKEVIGNDNADVHFLVGGTQVNFIVIAASLKSFQSVISVNTGHINRHETGAVENIGKKIEALEGVDAKISAKQIEKVAKHFEESGIKEHITQPKMVYISFPTEYGTVYSKEELTNIRKVCDKYGLYLMVDGARLGYGIAAKNGDVSIKDIAKFADVFYIGGTKCGALFGEAVVILNDDLKPDFRSYIKQNGGMLAKGWLLGLQFCALFHDNLYFDITKKAVDYAMKIKDAFIKKGIPLFIDSPTNQQFYVLNHSQIAKLEINHILDHDHKIDEEYDCIRICTGWHTTEESVNALINDINLL